MDTQENRSTQPTTLTIGNSKKPMIPDKKRKGKSPAERKRLIKLAEEKRERKRKAKEEQKQRCEESRKG